MKIEEAIKSKNFESIYHKTSINLLYTGYWLTEKVNTSLKQYGISEQQFNVLRILRGKKDGPATLTYVQERMLQPMSNATRLVEKLRLKGLVTRDLCATNRRQVEILISNDGLKLLHQIEQNQSINHKKLFSKLTATEVAELCLLLDKLRG